MIPGIGKSTSVNWGKPATLLLIDEYKMKSKIVDQGKMTKRQCSKILVER